jgi:hypothetical protein
LPKDTGVKAQVDEFIARWAKFPVKPVWREFSKYHPRSETASCRHINAAVALLPPFVQALKLTAKTVDGAGFSGHSLAGKLAVLWFGGRAA